MACRILFSADEARWAEWLPALGAAFKDADLDIELTTDASEPGEFRYMIHSPDGPVADFGPFTGLEAVMSTWAGVENIVGNETLTVPLARMVDPGMIEGMTEWVTGHVLRHHIGVDRHAANRSGEWLKKHSPPLARDRTVAMLGFGVLGQACARCLAGMRFNVVGWSRTPKRVDGFDCVSGPEGLREALSAADFVVMLLPLTAETENLMDARTIEQMKDGAVLLNVGRGALIDDDALLSALDSGKLSNATLDVFRAEPLPPGHPFWKCPKVTVSPHIASETRPRTASRFIAENVGRGLRGLPLRHIVDRRLGY